MSRYLLDTHVVIWALTADARLKRATRNILQQEHVSVSAVSLWEMLSKQQRKRLNLPPGRLIDVIERAGAHLIPLLPQHAEEAAGLHALQADPFDRMLVGTARIERMVLLTRDADLLERAAALLGPLLQEA